MSVTNSQIGCSRVFLDSCWSCSINQISLGSEASYSCILLKYEATKSSVEAKAAVAGVKSQGSWRGVSVKRGGAERGGLVQIRASGLCTDQDEIITPCRSKPFVMV